MKKTSVLILALTLLFFTISMQLAAQEDVVASSAFQEEPAETRPATSVERPVGGGIAFLPLIARAEVANPTAMQVFTLTNNERAQHGCPPLTLSPQLTTAAQNHSEDMGLNDFFSHTGSGGTSPWDRINSTGYNYGSAGENIAAGYWTPASVLQGWMNSPGHRANILNCGFEEIGVGYFYMSPDTGSTNYGRYWTQVFARPR